MRRRAGNLLALALGITGTLLAAELSVRLLWRDAPAGEAAESLPIEQVRDARVLYRLLPGASGVYNGTRVHVNSLGLRDRDYAIPAPAGTYRVLVLGDSMVFGVGLAPEQTLPGRLSRLLSPAEVINAGVFGYNLVQEISLLKDVGLRYRPDVVASCFVHNDIENWGISDGGAVPEIKSSRFDPPPRDAWSTRLADLMLPDTFDADHLNLLPRSGDDGGWRRHLARVSRLYLFAYTRLRTHSWNLTSGERRDPLIDTPACQTEAVIWEPLRKSYRELRGAARQAGADLVVVIQGGLLWEGAPLRRLHELLGEEGIAFLDLTPVWKDPEYYAANYSLGWDPHPNARADEISAELLAEFLKRAGLAPPRPAAPPRTPGPHDVIAARADLRGRLDEWTRRQASLVARQEEAWSRSLAALSSSVALGAENRSPGPGQILYGFWDPSGGPPPPSTGGRWLSRGGSVLLRSARGATTLAVDLTLPSETGALARTPESLRITLGAPPGRCAAAAIELPIPRHGGGPGAGGLVRVTADLPQGLRDADPLEVELSVDHPFQAVYLHPEADQRRGGDPRLVSFFVRRISLE